MYEVVKYEQFNLAGTALLYDLFGKNANYGVERVVVPSSRAIYDEGAYQCPEHGQVYPQPRTSSKKRNGLFDPTCPVCSFPSQRRRRLHFCLRRFMGLLNRYRSR
jgi:dTDP-L-rhamnose 4-epimerase